MNITELRYLVAIMECGSVSAAAKRLYAAQPNVSKALKNLEEEYHLRIFQRSSTGMIPQRSRGGTSSSRPSGCCGRWTGWTGACRREQERCAELRVMIPHATYASYAAVDYLEQAASIQRLHIHIREGGSMEHWIMSCGRGIIWLCCGTPWRMTSTIPITAPGGA